MIYSLNIMIYNFQAPYKQFEPRAFTANLMILFMFYYK